jgi:hypothetical protein
MRMLILTLSLNLSICFVNAQVINEKQVPKEAVAAFTKSYPSVKHVTWSKEQALFEVSFQQNKKDVSVLYDDHGVVKEVETEIKQNELPAAIQKYLTKNYPGYKINETAGIVADNIVSYEVEIEKEDQSYDLIFNAAGDFVKKIFREDEDSKDSD